MTTERRLERDLPSILGDLAMGPYPDYIDDVLAATARRRQRPAWTFPERWLPMDLATTQAPITRFPFRTLGILTLIALLVATAVAFLIGSSPRLPAPFGLAANGLMPYESDGDLYLGDLETGTSRLLLGGRTFDFDPAPSRDGTRILFGRRLDPAGPEPFHLMVMNVDGSALRQVTTEPVQAPNWWEWSPDGTRIVVVDKKAGEGVFTLLDPQGQAPPTPMAPGIDVDVPVFRPPDSAEIMFRGRIGSEVGIYVMAADGTGLRALVGPMRSENLDVTLAEPRYSPDGSKIAYHQWDDVAAVMRLYVMDADGTGRREFGAAPDIWFTGWPVWSNDGTRIAVQRARRTTDPNDNESLPYAIITIRDGSIVETGPPPSCCRIEWAPDDSKLLFLQEIDGVRRQLLLDPDGGPPTALPWTTSSYPNWQRIAH